MKNHKFTIVGLALDCLVGLLSATACNQATSRADALVRGFPHAPFPDPDPDP